MKTIRATEIGKLPRLEKLPTWHAAIQGRLIEITFAREPQPRRGGGKRKSIGNFSPQSRLRMLKLGATVDWRSVGCSLFITLTYPDELGDLPYQERTKQRHLFFRSMENYLCREVGAIWRIEWKKRLTGKRTGEWLPHFHVLALGVRFIDHQAIRAWWRSACGAAGPLATDVRAVKKGEVAARYVSKYCAKLPETCSLDSVTYLNRGGRHWGIHRKSLVPLHMPLIVSYLSPECVRVLKNAGMMAVPYFDAAVDSSFCLIGEITEKVGEFLTEFLIDKDSKLL